MLDLVLTRRRGLPILLSVVYIEVACRGAIVLSGVGLRGISWSAISVPILRCRLITSPAAFSSG
jgi:Transglutaminase-like superfamily